MNKFPISLETFPKSTINISYRFVDIFVSATSRRNSIDLGSRGRRSRRGSLDIYTAEYAVKMNNKKNITTMQQRNSFHMKLDNKEDSNLNLCGRCHLPNHK